MNDSARAVVADRAPTGVDPSKPNAARVYNYLLGGKDNYEIDQRVADRMLAVAPDTKTTAWFSRKFLLQAAEDAAAAGIQQFIDIGAGIPISPNVHEAVQKVDPAARVVMIDYDPVVHAHTNALLSGTSGVASVLADLRRTDELIERARTVGGINWAQPVAILMVGVLHFIMDDEHPAEIVACLRNAMAPGSVLAFTHGSVYTDGELMAQMDGDTSGTTAQCVFRTGEDIAAFLDGFEEVDPGVVPVQEWLGDDLPRTRLVILGAIGRKR
ncbi:SAM-dependent methyltransferase [Nocardia pseudovaccinii]|uniref:SAM-dependent methyltransferase n=1 Tax=Nocardia pseudovaccinii TaxID=189540 RepID=UPI0007A4A36A|nr:SAM-dependent methyltransferase [Nocardia pseudovaccinii]